MKDGILKFLRYLSRFVEDGNTGNHSVKRFGLALAVTVLWGIMLGLGVVICLTGMSVGPQYVIESLRILSNTLVTLAGLVLTAVTTGYLVDKATSRKKSSTVKIIQEQKNE